LTPPNFYFYLKKIKNAKNADTGEDLSKHRIVLDRVLLHAFNSTFFFFFFYIIIGRNETLAYIPQRPAMARSMRLSAVTPVQDSMPPGGASERSHRREV
jgi:hypothetical protein